MGKRVVVVTGASGGIGRACARAFAERGDDVALLARGDAGLEGAADDVRSAGSRALAIAVDMADHDAVEDAAAKIEAELGEIDVWVNVAFTSVFARFVDIEPAEFRRVTEVSYLGYAHGTRSALRRMLPRDAGHVAGRAWPRFGRRGKAGAEIGAEVALDEGQLLLGRHFGEHRRSAQLGRSGGRCRLGLPPACRRARKHKPGGSPPPEGSQHVFPADLPRIGLASGGK